ncbi:ecdysteroid-regulated 16 kDa protein [Papilio machaon]|uniref:ecdysteroid-regulated 16 kDa protein n=1 Tax=Papilio machaon TaxID=76193 RepID=UPI001E665C5B|nr:ecdysteroid-regulated 16 kDa protein [Papilio machaon]
MKNVSSIVFVLAAVSIALVWSDTNVTPAEQCEGQNFDDLRKRIQVIPCGRSSCKLQKGTNTTVVLKFKPEREVKTLVNEVYAKIGNLPLPFLGVTGVSACPQVTRVDGTPAPCPLAAGEEYVYTNVFPIESFYPTVNLRVHWELKDHEHSVICFEVPAVITAAKPK